MSEPFIFLTTHTINEGELEALLQQNQEFMAFLEANEPELQEFRVYLNDAQDEVTFCFVFPDADAADKHLTLAQAHIGRGLEVTQTARLEVLGAPGPLLQLAVDGHRELGVPVRVASTHLGGFSRSPALPAGVDR